jgi:hypothetical protein
VFQEDYHVLCRKGAQYLTATRCQPEYDRPALQFYARKIFPMLTATSQSYLCLHGSSTKTKTTSRIRSNSIPSDGLAPSATKPSSWKKHLSRSARAPEAALECRMSFPFPCVSCHDLVQPPIVASPQLILFYLQTCLL